MLFGSDRNVIRETVETFRPNAEAQARRGADYDNAALAQMAAEFQYRGQRGWFDRFMDGVNRIPRPAIVLGLLGMLVWTPLDPEGALGVFVAWAALPAGYWTILAIVVTFYFGGRYQAKTHELAKELAGMAVRGDISPADAQDSDIGSADTGSDAGAVMGASESGNNAALDEIIGETKY